MNASRNSSTSRLATRSPDSAVRVRRSSSRSVMRVSLLRRACAFAVLVLPLVLACSSADAPIGGIAAPTDLVATPVSPTVVKLAWTAPSGSVNGYEVQRRADLRGDFVTIEPSLPPSGNVVTYFDTEVDPDRFYGYR